MKSKRKTMLGVALAVAIIALAGVGYAAVTAYKGQTSTSGNQINTEYVTVSLAEGDDNATIREGKTVYTGQEMKLEYNTLNTNGTITYTLNSAAQTFKIVINVAATGASASQKYDMRITGLTAPEVPGATAVWTYSAGTVADNIGTATNKTVTELNGSYLTLTITPTGSGDAPDATIPIPEITFIVTAVTA